MITCDLLVVGGGITGLGIARLAARNGISCAVVDRADLASGASSASSHMLHGGLRYLEHGHVRLVRESLRERGALLRMAPTLTRPVRFLVPLYRGGRLPAWKLRAGLALYARLAGAGSLGPHAMHRREAALVLEPGLARDGLTGAGEYRDLVMDDARLAIAVARDAARHGATIRTYTELSGVREVPGGGFDVELADRIDGRATPLHCRVLVNAAGPRVDAVRRTLLEGLEGSRSSQPAAGAGRTPALPLMLRPSRGVHLVYPALTAGHGLLLTARADGRVFFVVPFGGRSLVGTTEVEVASPPPADCARPTVEEARYLMDEVRGVVPGAAGASPIAIYAGLRPLLRSRRDVGRATREHGILEERGMVTIAGGKYTTFRVMARDVLARVAPRLGRRAADVIDADSALPAPLGPGASPGEIASFAAGEEFARRLEDVLRRRTTRWLDPDRGRAAAPHIARAMAKGLGWSDARLREELDRYASSVEDETRLLEKAGAGIPAESSGIPAES